MGWGIFQYNPIPDQASAHAAKYDALFWTISILTVVFTLFVVLLILFYAIKYRRGTKVDRRNPMTHHNGLEALMMGVPLILALGIFGWSAKQFVEVRSMPKDAMEVFCIGKQWMWHFQHMNGIRENNELHVPVGQPVKLTMISQDVIHAMYLPEMRAQYHVVPGRYTELAFTPTKPGRYKILCAMHCGTQHSEMVGQLYVMDDREWGEWLEKGGNKYKDKPLNMVEAGAQVWKDKGCGNCHTGLDNPRAPSLVGILGKTRTMTDRTTAVADRDYLREAIKIPHNRITAGWENTMPVYGSTLTETQVLELVEFIKSLSVSRGEFQRTDMAGSTAASDGDSTAVDISNKGSSAGNAQFRSSEER
ncbi:MAG: cytochrome c oxidase subunit II [Fimbriimonadaceae bacterium]|nr:MAG: cytochrome c oxidase subunit II [Fimbriimonadaceae bacterium]